MQVKVLFLILMDLCRRTSPLAHPLPVSQVGSSSIQVRLHYIDGNYTVLPEVVEASLGPHMQVGRFYHLILWRPSFWKHFILWRLSCNVAAIIVSQLIDTVSYDLHLLLMICSDRANNICMFIFIVSDTYLQSE